MESDSIRARRLEIAEQEALARRMGPNGLIPSRNTDGNTGADTEEPVVEDPIEAASYDALLYLRDGMSREEVINTIVLRQRVHRSRVEQIVDQALQLKRDQNDKSREEHGEYEELQPDD